MQCKTIFFCQGILDRLADANIILFVTLGDGSGDFDEILSSSEKIPLTTNSSMSIANADINNDLIPELYVTQITIGEGAGFARNMIQSVEVCDTLSAQQKLDCQKDMRLNEIEMVVVTDRHQQRQPFRSRNRQ